MRKSGLVVAAVALATTTLAGQQRAVQWVSGSEVLESTDNVPTIVGAPFTADATTEFTQTLADGNRIEQSYSTSIARDGRGRTRRDQQMALVGAPNWAVAGYALTVGGAGGRGAGNSVAVYRTKPPRLVVITDPVERVTYTLDEDRKEARRSPMTVALKLDALNTTMSQLLNATASRRKGADAEKTGAGQPVVEQLGTRQFEGVTATGVRTTNTIPAGEIGNLAPINLVTERWFSNELGMAVQITRSDPRSGETVYRLTNIVRAEPPPDLFTVPADYTVINPLQKKLADDHRKLVDAVDELHKKLEDVGGAGGRGKIAPK